MTKLAAWSDPGIEDGALWLTWLVRLRWVAVVAQMVTLSFTFRLLESPALLLPLITVMIALVAGNLQAQHALTTKEHISQYFGLLALSGKVTSFLAPLTVGVVTALTASQPAGMSVILVFFGIGLLLLLRVRER